MSRPGACGAAVLAAVNAQAQVSVTDREGTLLEVNDAFCQHTGYTREELIGRSHHLLNSGVHQRRFWADMWRQITDGRQAVCNRTQQGTLYWVDVAITPIRNAAGQIETFVSLCTDITAAKQQEAEQLAAVRRGNALWEALQMHSLISITDGNGVISEANSAFCAMSGYRPAELIGQNHRLLNSGLHPAPFWQAMWRDISNGWPWRAQLCNRAKDGTAYWLDTFIAPVHDANGQVQQYICIQQDLTASRQQAAQLQAVQYRLVKSSAMAKLGIWTWDLHTGAMDWNDTMHELYGTSEAVRATGLIYEYWRSCVHPDDINFVEAQLQIALQVTDSFDSIFRITTPDGQTRYIRGAGIAEHNAQGEVYQVTGINLDITAQQEAIELRQAKQVAEAANEAKSTFLANISHELRTPMNAILGMPALVQHTELTPRQADYIGKTESAARALLGLLNDILDFSKAESNQMALDPQPFFLDAMLTDLAVILAPGVDNKPLEVLFDVAPDVPQHLIGDAMRLRQVLLNLGANAIKFTVKGEVVLSAGVLEITPTEVTLEFALRDTGIGIAPENQQRIFDNFSQAEASTSRRFGGTGLGLAISQQLVRLMRGRLKVRSELGKGSRFSFWAKFPLPTPAAATPQLPVPHSLHNAHLLIVDNHRQTREVLRRMVEALGCRVEVASSGEQALTAAQRHADLGYPFTALLLAWRMPGMDGLACAQQLHKLDLPHPPKLIAMLNAGEHESLVQRSETEQVLFSASLIKPITPPTLLSTLNFVSADPTQPNPSKVPAVRIARLTGMRILLVEDNLTNQQVACELLRAEGALVEVANHGAEALALLAAQSNNAQTQFHVVLMDVQMPVMDGFTATKRIRQQLKLRELPIVAMTANAMASDREACLRAGMNDHIGKPFEMSQLVQVLLTHSQWPGTSAALPAVESAEVFPRPPLNAVIAELISAAGLNPTEAIARLDGREDIYVRLLPKFVTSLLALPTQLEADLAQQNFASIQHGLHTLKGLTATMSADAPHRLIRQAEQSIAQDPPSALSRQSVLAVCQAIEAGSPALLRPLFEVVDQMAAVGS